MSSSRVERDIEQNSLNMASDTHGDGARKKKKVLVVGAGAAGMSAAYHMSNHPDKFDVTVIDSVNYCGGQAFSHQLDKGRHGASWFNQGVQGGSYIFHHTCTMFARQGYHADPVKLQVSFGKDKDFWTNVFPTDVLERYQKDIRKLLLMWKVMRWFEIFFALLPLKLVCQMFLMSEDFINVVALPMTALFLGTGNATPETPAMMLERLATSPTYGMWYPPDKRSVASNMCPMIVFPNFSEFYETWRKDLISRGVKVRLSTELVEIVSRDKKGVTVSIRPRTAVSDNHNPSTGISPDHPPTEGDADAAERDRHAPQHEEHFDELILCVLADTAKALLGRTASWRERKVLGAAKFSNDITITHTDSDYMKKHYENFYRPDLAVMTLNKQDQTQRNEFGKANFRPMYYIKTYPKDKSKLEMCFDTTNYQCQFPERVPFEDHVFQTIFLNKDRDGHLWSDEEIDSSKVIRKDWWHQLCHSYTHYIKVVPWMMFLQAKRSVRFGGSWTVVNAHEVAVMSGIAAAVDLGAEYPEDLENDKFAFLCFRLYYLLCYGKWYSRRYKNSTSEAAKAGRSWANGLYGQRYKGPGVMEEERCTWKEEMKLGRSTGNLAEGNAEGRSQP